MYNYNKDFFKTWSHDMAYILGFIMADGYVNKNVLEISISSKDINILKYIAKYLGSNLVIKHQTVYDTRYKKYYNKSRLFVYCKEIILDLYNLGVIPQKTGKEIIPNMPTQFLSSFICGVFDGDGNVRYNQKEDRVTCGICSASKGFLCEIRENINNIGHICAAKPIWSFNINKYDEVLQFYNYIYQNVPFALDRKRQKFKLLRPLLVRYWTIKEDNILKQFYPNIKAIKNYLSYSTRQIRNRAYLLGLRSANKNYMFSETEQQFIITNFDANNAIPSIKNLSKKMNRPFLCIRYKIKRMGILYKSPRKKWDSSEIQFVITNATTWKVKDLAKYFNVSISSIYNIMNRNYK